MAFYSDAANGKLTPATLTNYLQTCKIDDPGTERGNGTFGLTPLALAACKGHVDAVRLLLENGAKADALSSQNRTPLWLVAARGRGEGRAEIVELLLKEGADAKYCHPSLKGGSTPLENELKQLQDPEVIQLLVENGGTTDAAKKLAAELGDPEIDDAMQSKQERSKIRAAIVNLVTALILFILAWANSVALTGIANKIFKKFEISGNKDSEIAKKITKASGREISVSPFLFVSL